MGGDIEGTGAARQSRDRAAIVVEAGARGRRANECPKRETLRTPSEANSEGFDEPGRLSGFLSVSGVQLTCSAKAGERRLGKSDIDVNPSGAFVERADASNACLPPQLPDGVENPCQTERDVRRCASQLQASRSARTSSVESRGSVRCSS